MMINALKAMKGACDENQQGGVGEEVVRNVLRWYP